MVRDFSVNSLEEAVTPLVITLLSASDLQKGFYLQLRLRPENREEILQQIEAVWNEMNPNQPFGYADMHRDFMARNGKVLSLSHILTFYAVIGLLLTGFGLFGIAGMHPSADTRNQYPQGAWSNTGADYLAA